MGYKKYPRIMTAGLGGDSGKTFVSCGLMRYFRNSGLKVGAFKKGPDYIDPAWLSLSSGSEARNYDTFLMSKDVIINNFTRNGINEGINIFEGNRGLYDGFDSAGSHSSAELAKLLNIPVLLIVTVKKVTRTVAAIVLGCKHLDNTLNIAGVIINQVGTKRQEKVIRQAVEDSTGIPVVGAIPKLDSSKMPSRHLGLITPAEYEFADNSIEEAAMAIAEYVDTDTIVEIANSAEELEYNCSSESYQVDKKLRIAYFSDRAFSFYYKENLEALEKEAELIKVSSIEDKLLPEVDALYIGGGFPETNIQKLCANSDLMKSIKAKVEEGLPVYAECGGLMYLCDSIELDGNSHKLSGIFPIRLKMSKKPLGHGYSEAEVVADNTFYEKETKIRGHEFHYSGVSKIIDSIDYSLKLSRGKGVSDKQDGLSYKNVFASYIHIHSQGCPEWSIGMIKAAKNYRISRS